VVMHLDEWDVGAVLGWDRLIAGLEAVRATFSAGRVIQLVVRHRVHGLRRHPGVELEGGAIPPGVAGGT